MTAVREIFDLTYADYGGRVMKLDLFLPANPQGLVPAVIFIRGGGWVHTTKAGLPDGRMLASDGFAAAVIEYRSTNEAIAPANVHDCKAAVRWMRVNAGTYGIDPEHIGVMGGSAGGHLVALLGTSMGVKELEGDGGNANVSSDVKCVVDFCGPTDLLRIAIPEIRKQFGVLYDVTAKYLGGPVEERRELAQLVSPLRYVSKKSAPTLLLHGDVDDVVPLEESIIFHEALQKAGVESSLRVMKGKGHGWDPELTRSEINEFLNTHLAV